MLLGVPRPELCGPIAHVLQSLGVRRALVVCGAVENQKSEGWFLDELSTLGENTVAEFYQESGFNASILATDHFQLQRATLEDLAGSDRQSNAQIVRRLLEGQDRGPKRDAVLLNTAAALMVGGRARTITAGWDLAAGVIDSGDARRKLEALSIG